MKIEDFDVETYDMSNLTDFERGVLVGAYASYMGTKVAYKLGKLMFDALEATMTAEMLMQAMGKGDVKDLIEAANQIDTLVKK